MLVKTIFHFSSPKKIKFSHLKALMNLQIPNGTFHSMQGNSSGVGHQHVMTRSSSSAAAAAAAAAAAMISNYPNNGSLLNQAASAIQPNNSASLRVQFEKLAFFNFLYELQAPVKLTRKYSFLD